LVSTGRPFWYRFAWFLGRPPELSSRQWRVLGLVAAVSFFETYDMFLFTLNLKQIQADLGVAEADLGLLGSLVRAGALFSLFIAVAADRVGRRRMLLITIVAYTLLTGLTAFSPNAETFVVLQFFARAFAVAETILAMVVIVEEFPAEHRGWGVGAAGAIQACGGGFAALLFGFVDVLPYGWRALYLVGLVPLMLVAYWRRTLPETERFKELATHHQERLGANVFSPILELGRRYPRRFWALAAAVFMTSVATSSAGFFAPKYLQDAHGWSPANIALMTVIGGAVAILGNPLAGWLSDTRGRRPITAVFACGVGVSAMLLYNASGVLLPVFWIVFLFFQLGTGVTEGTYSAEMFPTSQRSTAAGARALTATLGAIVGLAGVSALFPLVGSNWAAVSVLAGGCFVVPIIVLVFFPETARRALEDIAPDVQTEADSEPLSRSR
jgi:putative MFS transporter